MLGRARNDSNNGERKSMLFGQQRTEQVAFLHLRYNPISLLSKLWSPLLYHMLSRHAALFCLIFTLKMGSHNTELSLLIEGGCRC